MASDAGASLEARDLSERILDAMRRWESMFDVHPTQPLPASMYPPGIHMGAYPSSAPLPPPYGTAPGLLPGHPDYYAWHHHQLYHPAAAAPPPAQPPPAGLGLLQQLQLQPRAAAPQEAPSVEPDITDAHPHAADVHHRSKDEGPALLKVLAGIGLTAEQTEARRLGATRAGAAAGAFLLSLVKDPGKAEDTWEDDSRWAGTVGDEEEGILEAELHTDGLHYVEVDGDWLEASAKYYCLHCGVFGNQMQAHIASSHHQKNKQKHCRRTSSTSSGGATVPDSAAAEESWTERRAKREKDKVRGSRGKADADPPQEGAPSTGGGRKESSTETPLVPAKPAPPWQLAWSQEHAAYYYWNTSTGTVQWERPGS